MAPPLPTEQRLWSGQFTLKLYKTRTGCGKNFYPRLPGVPRRSGHRVSPCVPGGLLQSVKKTDRRPGRYAAGYTIPLEKTLKLMEVMSSVINRLIGTLIAIKPNHVTLYEAEGRQAPSSVLVRIIFHLPEVHLGEKPESLAA